MRKLVFAVLSVLLVAGCGDTVRASIIERAQEFCKAHGGLDYIETVHMPFFDFIEWDGDIEVECRNGTTRKLVRLTGS